MTKARELIMATLGLLPLVGNASTVATDGNKDEGKEKRPNIIFIMCDAMASN